MRILMGCAAALLMAAATAGEAAVTDFSFQGRFSGDTDVAVFRFSVGTTSSVTLRTYGYAGGVQADGTRVPAGGFDPILALFDPTGRFVTEVDDGDDLPADPRTGSAYDASLTTVLTPGRYFASLQQYDNFTNEPTLTAGFFYDGLDMPAFTSRFGCAAGVFCDVEGNDRSGDWAVDILGVDDATVVPVPAALPLFATALGGLVWIRRRRG